MKILCLHGRGSSGAIFKSQTSSIRSRLTDLDLKFDFIDGPYPCSPAPGLDLFYKGPYYSFYPDIRTENKTPAANADISVILKAQEWLEGVIRDLGPYDMVLGFSQGTAVASAALLLYAAQVQAQSSSPPAPHQLQTPDESEDSQDAKREMFPPPTPFKSAIFICGGASLPLLEHIGYTISPLTKARDFASRAALKTMASSGSILSHGSNRWTGSGLDFPSISVPNPYSFSNPYPTPLPTPSLAQGPSPSLSLGIDLDGTISSAIPPAPSLTSESDIRREMVGPIKISIPTVHIYGERDPRYVAGIQLSEVCERGKRKVYNHGGGHEIPRFEAVSGALADLVRWAVRAAEEQEE
ncbi:putative EF-hand calcium-binding domain protein [Aspergillus stella-maris]|uniref:putative EF-hand calcium-binding domain protein n=1 Tax=Aspergillus stella-maris TaxID=1810926 RepID=UPI003CCE350E